MNAILRLTFVLALTFLLTSAPQMFAQTTLYSMQVLSDAAQGGDIFNALNNVGDAVGKSRDPSAAEMRATVWNHRNAHTQLLPAPFRDEYASAFAINDKGEVVGASNTSSSVVPVLWAVTGGIQLIPMPRGNNGGQATGISNNGHVVGYLAGLRGTRAFVWTSQSGVRLLPGGISSTARSVNDAGMVAGRSHGEHGDRAVVWTAAGDLRDLGTLPGDAASEAVAINQAGEVVGYSRGPQGMRAFRWTEVTGMQSLGVLVGGASSRAFSINTFGYVVGSCASSFGDRAFLWTQQMGMVDLNSAISDSRAVLMEAHSINDSGQIIAVGKILSNSPSLEGVPTAPIHECAPAPQITFLLKPK